MKYLLLILICLSSLVHADVVATTDMTNGNRLFLFNTKGKCENGYAALLAGNAMKPLSGCWIYEEKKIYLQYDDGDFRVYPIEGFNIRQPTAPSNEIQL